MKKLPVIALLTVLLISACAPEKERAGNYVTIEGFALGTSYKFIVNMPDTAGLHMRIDSLFDAADRSMSVYREGSLINRLNDNSTDQPDRHIAYNIALARRFSELSGGMYDITVKPVTRALGFEGGKAEENPDIDSLLQLVGYEKISIRGGRLVKERPEIEITLNSIAKGYIVDMFGRLMSRCGAEDYLVEIGGEIACRGLSSRGKEWNVGIDKPIEGNMVPGQSLQTILRITDAGMATSGDYRKFYYDKEGRKVAHIVNALTGRTEATDILSATVFAENCATADAAATTFMVVGLDRAKEILRSRPDWMAYLISDDGRGGYDIYMTDNLKSRIVKPGRK